MNRKLPCVTLSYSHGRYPPLLKEIPDPPRILYVRGTGSKLRLDKTIAVVGARRCSAYGKEIAMRLVTDLVKRGVVIVSGLAYGIDTIAHWAAIRAGGKTIAVLGSGLDIIHPSRNTDLYWQIVNGNGAAISEIPPGIRPDKKQFVTRNRIISGLSLGVVVIEGTDKSGTLITARYAAEQGRDVFAVPGPLMSETSRASNILLKNGAKLVESANDILEEYE